MPEYPGINQTQRAVLGDKALYALSLRMSDDPATLEDFLVTPASPEQDPLVQVRLIRGSGGDCLCVKVQHVVADGRAAMDYLYLLSPPRRGDRAGLR